MINTVRRNKEINAYQMSMELLVDSESNENINLYPNIKFIDLFCGIGGFRFAAESIFEKYNITGECVFSSDIDEHAQESYASNFGERPSGDITKINEIDIPDHDLLFAGFPCQPFSIIGLGKGFNDTRGTLFFEVARIIEAKIASWIFARRGSPMRLPAKGYKPPLCRYI